MGECFPTVANIITFRGMDTISVAPESQTKLKCVSPPDTFDVDKGSKSVMWNGPFQPNKSSIPFFTDFYREVVHRRKKPVRGCEFYLDYEEFTYMFVDDILKTAVDMIAKNYKKDIVIKNRRESSSRNITSWPTIENFNISLGATKIVEYIDGTSEMTEDWAYSLELVAKQSSSVSDFYKYEVKFGIPTKCFPVAQATASVYFTYEVSRVRPGHCPVDVTYQVEASNCTMIPGRNFITEELLFRVVDAKIKYFKKFTA
nr:A-kinase anchor protein 14-like [Leptinotarsa decemlineata]